MINTGKLKNFGNIYSLNDISTSFRTLWDEDNIYFGLNVIDDKITKNDRIIIKLDTELLKDLNTSTPNHDDFILTLIPDVNKKQIIAELAAYDGKLIKKLDSPLATTAAGYSFELSLPRRSIGISNNHPHSLGMGVELVDSDGNDKLTILSWTGNYMPTRSPRGYGQLVLRQ